MSNMLNVSSSPHLRSSHTTGREMYNVILSLLPAEQLLLDAERGDENCAVEETGLALQLHLDEEARPVLVGAFDVKPDVLVLLVRVDLLLRAEGEALDLPLRDERLQEELHQPLVPRLAEGSLEPAVIEDVGIAAERLGCCVCVFHSLACISLQVFRFGKDGT